MLTDFWASYISGALGICIGNRLDIIKTELQAGNRYFVSSTLIPRGSITSAELPPSTQPSSSRLQNITSLFRGAAAPIVGYGALNSILFMTYNRTLAALDPSIPDYNKLAGVGLGKIYLAGLTGGLACWVVSAPSELIKCRTQLQIDGKSSSYEVVVDTWRRSGLRGFYVGGAITSVRDSFGYAWYFWTYELSKRLLLSARQPDPFADPNAVEVLIAGGIAGVVTWASVYPLDVVKTRLQTQSAGVAFAVSASTAEEATALLAQSPSPSSSSPKSSWSIARDVVRTEGVRGLYRGLGICSLRAFIVNAAQWYIYERTMQFLGPAAL